MLQDFPKNDKNRKFYENLFITLSARVAELQSTDGFWHASMLDPASYPSPETSATGFIVYALAYGINEGLLDKDTYLPIVEKGWKALALSGTECKSQSMVNRQTNGKVRNQTITKCVKSHHRVTQR